MALWTPAQLGSDLALWLDADDASTITLNGSTVSQWSDKSSNAILFSQPTASSQPSYGVSGLAKNTLNFDGADDFLDGDDVLDTVWTGPAWQIFFVAKNNAAATQNGTILSKVSASPLSLRQFASYLRTNRSQIVTLYTPDTSNYTVVNGSTVIADSQWVFSSQAYTDTGTGSANTTQRVEIVVDGSEETEVVVASAGSLSTIQDTDAHLSVGAIIGDGTQLGGVLDGSIGEILVTSTLLPDYEREKLEGYLAHKWGLEANLPSGHPYKSAAPTVDDPRAVSNWTPANITGLWSWHDWSTDDYRINDNKNNVSGWQDRSTNNHDLTLQTISLGSADMTATAINGVQAYGSTTGQQGWTVSKLTTELDKDFLLVGMAAKMPTSGTNDFFVSARDDAGIAWQISNPNSSTLSVGMAATGTYPSYSIGTGNAFILVVRYDLRVSGTSPLAPPGFMVRSRLNGDLTDDRDAHTIASYAPSNVRVGIGCQPSAPNIVSCAVNAAFGEVVIASRNTEFTVADVQRLEGYLAWKWGGL